MEPDSVTRDDFEQGLGDLRQEFETKLEKTQDRLLTAIFGFVNGASARMERLESVDNGMREEITALDRRVRAMERRGSRTAQKKDG